MAILNFGTVLYENGIYKLPVDIYEDDGTTPLKVISLTAGDFSIHPPTILEMYLTESNDNNTYELNFIIPENENDKFNIDLIGEILDSDFNLLTVSTTPKTVIYDTRIPYIKEKTVPSIITSGIWDVYLDFNMLIKNLSYDAFNKNQVAVLMGEPKIYYDNRDMKDSNRPQEVLNERPEDVGWELLDNSIDNSNLLSQFYLFRYDVPEPPPTGGQFAIETKRGAIEGRNGTEV